MRPSSWASVSSVNSARFRMPQKERIALLSLLVGGRSRNTCALADLVVRELGPQRGVAAAESGHELEQGLPLGGGGVDVKLCFFLRERRRRRRGRWF